MYLLLLLLSIALPLSAHEGHDHAPSPPAVTFTRSPRLEIQSDDLELVAVLEGEQLIIYLDTFATNEPVTHAQIEVESGPLKQMAQATQAGIYTLSAKPLAKAGPHEVMFTIQTPKVSDLLLGHLIVPKPANVTVPLTSSWFYSPWVLYAVLSLWLLTIVAMRNRHRPLVLLSLMAITLASLAHEGHEPNDTLIGNLSNQAPTRLPNGEVWVPKPVQRWLGLRTIQVQMTRLTKAIELNGHVIADPNYSGYVQAPLPGQIELAQSPNLGERVNKGQILAYLIPIADTVDRATQQGNLADLDGQIKIVESNLKRLQQLKANAPQRELEETVTQLASLQNRQQVIVANLHDKLPLLAPVSGVISERNAQPGQIVEAREILFSIINPEKLWVEAITYDPSQAEQITAAQARTSSEQTLSLSLLGIAYQLHEHTLPIQFQIEPPLPLLSVAQPVKVYAQTKQALQALALPDEAIEKGQHGEKLVWVHSQAEHFKTVEVQVEKVDANRVAVLSGLRAGERVVTHGATWLNQIR